MTVINVTLYSTICLMHRSEELSFPLWYEAAVVVTTICYIRFPSIKMPSGTVKTAGEYDTEFVYLSPSSILHFFSPFVCMSVCDCMSACVRGQAWCMFSSKSDQSNKFRKLQHFSFSTHTYIYVFCFADPVLENASWYCEDGLSDHPHSFSQEQKSILIAEEFQVWLT